MVCRGHGKTKKNWNAVLGLTVSIWDYSEDVYRIITIKDFYNFSSVCIKILYSEFVFIRTISLHIHLSKMKHSTVISSLSVSYIRVVSCSLIAPSLSFGFACDKQIGTPQTDITADAPPRLIGPGCPLFVSVSHCRGPGRMIMSLPSGSSVASRTIWFRLRCKTS